MVPPVRSSLIRLFGGSVGRRCRFARQVEIAIPWNLRIGNDVQVGERTILYSLGVITLGDEVVIDYKAHLCAGSHDLTDTTFPLTTPAITVGAASFIGLDAYIGPGVALGEGCRVAPRASVFRDVATGAHVRGNPALVSDEASPAAGGESP